MSGRSLHAPAALFLYMLPERWNRFSLLFISWTDGLLHRPRAAQLGSLLPFRKDVLRSHGVLQRGAGVLRGDVLEHLGLQQQQSLHERYLFERNVRVDGQQRCVQRRERLHGGGLLLEHNLSLGLAHVLRRREPLYERFVLERGVREHGEQRGL